MSLTVLHNAAANVANRLLTVNDAAVSRTVAKLSAGQRVLAARDDAAALAIGSRLRAEVASLSQASINAGQAASMLQVADGATAQIDAAIVRMKALSVQAASQQVGSVERAMLDTEFQAVKAELDRIAKVTNFNGRSLLEGDVEDGIVYTVRSKMSSGVLFLNGNVLGLGGQFSQEDLNAGRVTFRHDGTTATSETLIVSVSDRDGNAIGTRTGEVDRIQFETGEYHASTGLDNIKASAAYARGATGAGVTVAIVDTGIDIDHVDFQNNLSSAVDIVDNTVEGLSFSFAANTFVSGGGGEVSAIRVYDVAEGVDLFEAGFVPTVNITGGSAAAASVTLSLGGTDYSGTINLVSGGPLQTHLVTLTETNGTRTIDIGLDTTMSAGAITSGGPVLVQFSTATTGDGNDDTVSPDQGHGTHVAGIAVAEKNGIGTHGVAFDSRVISVNVAAAGGGLDFNDVADAIDLARANGADVINLSLGTPGFVTHTALQTAIERAVEAGIVIVASTGNDSLSEPGFQANFAIQSEAGGMLVAVVATDDNDALASFSNQAGVVRHFSVAAPGVGIISTTNDGQTGSNSGTSMAAPMVAGSLAVLGQAFPELSGEELVSLLMTSAKDLGETGIDGSFGHGLIDLQAATNPLLSLNINVNATTTVAGALNVAPETTGTLSKNSFDFTTPFEGRLDVADRAFTYRVGTGSAAADDISVGIGSLTANSLGVDQLSIGDESGAAAANEALNAALAQVVAVRAAIGASQNRLEVAISNLTLVSENTEAARSQLMDLDVAAEVVRFTSRSMLTQSGVSMLAQANQQSQLILDLLN